MSAAAPASMRVVQAKVADLKPWARNPRKITAARLEQLKRALQAEPEMLRARPLIALPDGTVIAGNQRLAAAVALGWRRIPVMYADLDAARATEWALRDNRPYGEDLDDEIGVLLAELADAGRDLDLTGYDSAEIDRLLADTRPAADPDDAPPLPAKARSKLGGVYELGRHVVGCGDSTDPEFVREVFGHIHPLEQVDCIWTDPPYGVDYVGKTGDALKLRNDDAAGLPALLADAFAAIRPWLAHNARFYVAGPPGPRRIEFLTAIRDAGWVLHQGLVWRKNRMVLGHSDYHYAHEPIFYGWIPHPDLEGAKGRPGRGAHHGTRWYGGNDQTTVLEYDSPARSEEHPTMKPVAMIEAFLTNSTQRGTVVYDGFAGSGSTLIACEQTARRCVAMEIDPGYCDVIRDRYEAFVGGSV